MFFLLVSSVQAVPSNGVAYYQYTDNVNDQWNSNNGVFTNPVYSTSYPTFNTSGDGSTKSGSFDGSNAYVTSDQIIPTGSFSINTWISPDSIATTSETLFSAYSSAHYLIVDNKDNHPNKGYRVYMNGGWHLNTATDQGFTTGSWQMLTITYDHIGDTLKIYRNAVEKQSEGSVGTNIVASGHFYVGARGDNPTSNNFDGLVDETKIYNSVLTPTNITNLFNVGNATIEGGSPPPPTSYFDLTAKDNKTNSTINIFNVTIDLNNGTSGLFFSTTNGTINTGINQSQNLLSNLTFESHNYFDREYLNYNTSNDLNSVILHYPKIQIYDNETLKALSNFNVSLMGGFWTTTNGTIYFPHQITKTIDIKSLGYTDKTITFNFENATNLNTPIFYNLIRFTIHAFEAPSNTTQILNFTIDVESLNSSFSSSDITSNGTLNVEYPRNEVLNMTFDNLLYAFVSDLISPQYNDVYNFSVYPTNSVYLYIYGSGGVILNTTQINITLNGAEYQSVFTTNGTYRFENINDGYYQLDLEAGSYSDNTYYFSLDNRTHRELDLYMSSTCTDITFSILDAYQSILEGVVTTFYQQINGSWVNVGQKTTDISGNIQICLEEESHLIQAVKTGYETWEGTLTPYESEYTIFLDLIGARVYESLFDDITFIYSPHSATLNGNLTNITITAYSPKGKILYFGLNTTYHGTSYIDNVTTFASGGVASIELPLRQDDDNEFAVDFFVKSVGGSYHHFKINYQVFDFAISQYSLVSIFEEWKTQEGDFAVIFWVYVMILIALGLIHLAGGRGIVLLIFSILLIGIFSSPLIAAINGVIGVIQIVILIMMGIAMSRKGLL